MARDGNFDEARLLVLRIRDGQSRARGFAEVAAAQASAGDFKGALATAGQIEEKLARAEALARIAALRATTLPAASRELFTQSLALMSNVRGAAEP